MKLYNWRLTASAKLMLARFSSTVAVPKRDPSNVRVRFAPSPTGHLHLGGFRTALYNYLFAKSQKGKFILRIEDTDQTRFVPGAAEELEKVLNWSGLVPDESPLVGGDYGPYNQSKRLHIYSKYADDLIERGLAYRCFCTEKRLELLKREAMRTRQANKYDRKCLHVTQSEIEDKLAQKIPFTIRFLLPPEIQTFDDMIYGNFSHDVYETEGDPIIVKSDGFPTYHFANVVDDHLMDISHVLRGSEWQVSTPKHLLLYKAFDWEPPTFGHLPLIMNSDGTKLSKRQGALHMETLRKVGFYPEAVLNFVTLVGGGFDEKENRLDKIYHKHELCDKFNIVKVNTASCKIDMDNLNILNRRIIKEKLKCESEKRDLQRLCREVIKEKVLNLGLKIDDIEDATIERYLVWSQDRINKLEDIVGEDLLFLWVLPVVENCHISVSITTINNVIQILKEEKNLDKTLMKSLKNLGKRDGIKFPVLMKDLRVLITGNSDGPPILELLVTLGSETVIKRLDNYILNFKEN